MKITRVAFCLPLAFFFFAAASAAKVTITNKCPYTVWPATLTGGDNPQQLSKTGFELQNGASDSVDVPAPWKGRFWARTGCSSDSGKFACATGDCASGQVGCNGATGQPPATLAELTVAAAGGQDNYDVSNVDGFNVPVSIAPQGGSGDCRSRSCPANINSACPADLQVNGTDGSVIGCKSACVAFNQDQYCCKGAFNSSQTCQPTDYSRFFKNQCPEAYSYAYDDPASLVTCSGGPSYTVTFCPN